MVTIEDRDERNCAHILLVAGSMRQRDSQPSKKAVGARLTTLSAALYIRLR